MAKFNVLMRDNTKFNQENLDYNMDRNLLNLSNLLLFLHFRLGATRDQENTRGIPQLLCHGLQSNFCLLLT